MAESEGLIAGIDSKAGHSVDFITATHVLFPIRQGQVDAAKRNQKARPLLPAFGCQSRVDPMHIFGEQRLETASPGLDDPMLLELRDESVRIAVLQCAKWPIEEIHVGVDDS